MSPPKYILRVLERLTGAGFDARLVGGCVRDTLMGRRPHDWDLASSASPQQALELFPGSLTIGMKHGTVGLRAGGRIVELTSYRAEGAYSDHRRPDEVRFPVSLREDLSRRDFTVNAMAMDAQGQICDPFGGQEDLRARRLRCVGEPELRFSEDALRMLRCLRFSAQLGFEIEPATLAAVSACAPLARGLSAERVRNELLAILRSPRPELIGELISLGLLDAFLRRGEPRLRPLRSLPQYARMARLCAELQRAGCIDSAEDFLTALRLDRATVSSASGGAALLLSGTRDYKRALRDFGPAATRAAFPADRELAAVLQGGDCWNLRSLAIGGRELSALGFRGEELGRELDRLLDFVIDFPHKNDGESLCKLAKKDWEMLHGQT